MGVLSNLIDACNLAPVTKTSDRLLKNHKCKDLVRRTRKARIEMLVQDGFNDRYVCSRCLEDASIK